MNTVDGSIESLFGFYDFTSGRRLYALRKVRTLAHEEGFTELVKHCDAAVTHEGVTREIERRWAAEPTETKANPAAQKVDILVDRTLGAIRDHAVAQGAAPDDPIHATATATATATGALAAVIVAVAVTVAVIVAVAVAELCLQLENEGIPQRGHDIFSAFRVLFIQACEPPSFAPSTLLDAPGNPGDPRSAPTRRSRMM